jgi:CPA1 family monovalent cation:H+ antiporter
LSAPHITWLFVRSYVGGVLAGALVAWVGAQVRRRLDDPLLDNVAILLIPFTAFLAAEGIGASGVLAVVACGLIMSQVGPRVGRPDTRLIAQGFWSLSTFVLNGALFVMIGIQAQAAVRALSSFDFGRAVAAVLAVTVTLIVVRVVFQFVAIYAIRALDRRPSQRLRRVSHRFRVVSGLSGYRGAVSLAAALAVPQTVDGGGLFPDRDVIIFVTAGVIAATMLQTLVLPAVLRWANLPADETLATERRLAKLESTQAALDAVPQLAVDLRLDPEVAERAQTELREALDKLRAGDDDSQDAEALRLDEQYRTLRLALLARKRETVLQLRSDLRIDDAVLRQVQARLDIEEVRLSREELVD